jgi:hypothetical protein
LEISAELMARLPSGHQYKVNIGRILTREERPQFGFSSRRPTMAE